MFFDRSTSGNVITVRRSDPEMPPPRVGGSGGLPRAVSEDPAPNVRQFLVSLQSDVRSLTRTETANAVIAVTPTEVERVARTVAKLRGRYLAQVLDLGHPNRPPLTDSEIGQLQRSREWYEEIERGFAALRSAIETGEVPLEGIRRD